MLTCCGCKTPAQITITKAPVIVDLAPVVVSEQSISMHQLASGSVTTAVDLPKACQDLYHNVTGVNITLETPEFPGLRGCHSAEY